MKERDLCREVRQAKNRLEEELHGLVRDSIVRFREETGFKVSTINIGDVFKMERTIGGPWYPVSSDDDISVCVKLEL